MPIKFVVTGDGPTPLEKMQGQVRDALHLPATSIVLVAMSETYIRHGDLELTLPMGAASVKNSADFTDVRSQIISLFAGVFTHGTGDKYVADTGTLKTVEAVNPKPVGPKSYSDMNDEEWVQAVSSKLFPGVLPLHSATEMHQPVFGTGSGSIYKTCFIGPELKVAARLKKSSVSLRVTTNLNTVPEGQVRAIFERLGVVNAHADRLTCHAHMSGSYTADTAGEYRALFGAFYAALRPWLTSGFPAIAKLAEGVK